MTFKQRGLRFEITVSLALLVAAAVGFMGLVVFKHSQRSMIGLKVESGLNLVRVLEERLKVSSSDADIQSLVDKLSRAGFESIVVLDVHGRVLAQSSAWSWRGRPTRTELGQALISRRMLTYSPESTLFFFGPDPTLALAVPLTDGFRPKGVVGLYSSMPDLHVSWARTRWIIFIYLAADTLAVVFFGTYILSRRFVRPLSRVLDRVQSLARGEYRPGLEPVSGIGEIGELEKAFEDMAGELIESQRKLEENLRSLQEAQEGLIHSEKMATVGRLAAGLAHELGNPLGAVLGFVHLLKRGEQSEEVRIDFLNRIQSELNRMDSIIRALLDFARPSTPETGPVNLNELIVEGLALAEVQKWYKGLTVATELSENLPPARAEMNRLIQVLLNLMTNAGQSMPDGGALTLGTNRGRKNEVCFWVADTGTGIEDQDLEKIFEPFFTLKEPGQGTGLGLSVSQSIVTSFGGRIEVESRPGRGSRFTVVLPAYRV